jgi:transcriptional regulator with PAS, ATPase and Fis domain
MAEQRAELESVIGRAMISMKPGDRTIEVTHLPLFECSGSARSSWARQQVRPLGVVLAEAERAAIERALHEAKGNREQAAQLLGTAVGNLYYKIKKYKIKP